MIINVSVPAGGRDSEPVNLAGRTALLVTAPPEFIGFGFTFLVSTDNGKRYLPLLDGRTNHVEVSINGDETVIMPRLLGVSHFRIRTSLPQKQAIILRLTATADNLDG